jgi:hypothetical protein
MFVLYLPVFKLVLYGVTFFSDFLSNGVYFTVSFVVWCVSAVGGVSACPDATV